MIDDVGMRSTILSFFNTALNRFAQSAAFGVNNAQRMRRAARAAAVVLLGLSLVSGILLTGKERASAATQEDLPERIKALSPEALEEMLVFVAGNTLFTLYHEAGHMLVSELGLPVLGQEEDAVDNLATITMLSRETDDMDLLLSNAMIGWFLIAEEDYDSLLFYGEHDLDLQRGYQMLCLMVGSDPDAFGDLAIELELPEERIETCSFDYDQSVTSWESVTDPHLHPEEQSAATSKGQISVRYSAAPEDLELLSVFLYESQLMESVAEELDALYALPSPVTFNAMTCGEENAYWDPQAREMTLCYELMAGFADVYLNELYSGG
ncbi:DUF4344 domain-containing metallopeptidase [Roseibium sp.]|uniref:DUF4344 domain-containing metallopeptidase n=1 Tax=Roseibium sp. TaxID=1936156 RepID=UPI003A98433B